MTEQRQAVTFLVAGGLAVPRACTLVQIARSTFRYVAQPRDDTLLMKQIQQLAARHPRYGYRRISALLRRTRRVNEKRVRRLWRKQGLQVQRVRRPRPRPLRPARFEAAYPGHIWAYDFVEDALLDGTPLWILTVMDEFTFLRSGAQWRAEHIGRAGDRCPERACRPARRACLSP
jgi:putative transposase